MFGVVTGHAILSLYEIHTVNYSLLNTFRVLLMNICVLAVNCFVMISGYFRIKQSWRGIVGLWLQLFFYACLTLFASLFLKQEQSLIACLTRIAFPLSESGLWFIVAYIGLYLFAPIINSALDYQTKRQKVYSLVFLLIIDVYLGYMHQAEEITTGGYHLFHFIVLYWLGNCIHEFKPWIDIMKWGGLFWLVVIVNTGLHAVKMSFPPIAIIYSMRYNAPMILVASFCLFAWATQWTLQSSLVNRIAKSVLSVYICSEFLPLTYYGVLHWIQNRFSPGLELVLVPVYIIVFFYAVVLFDRVRITITMPIQSWVSNKLDSVSDRLNLINLDKIFESRHGNS